MGVSPPSYLMLVFCFQVLQPIQEIKPIQEQIVNKATASQIKRGALERGLKTLRMTGLAEARAKAEVEVT